MSGQLGRLWLAVGAFTLLPLAAEAQTPQARGVVRGRVVAQATNAPVPEAQVQVVGTQLGGRTDAQGNYTITGVPAGAQRVRALRIGFEAGVQSVTLAGGDTATANFTLAPSAVQLSQVVVTATGEEVRRREQGVTVSSIRTDSVPLAPIQNFSQLVQGRAAGVTITQTGGTTGSGAIVRIRGSNSLNQSNEPLIVIDGVRVNSAAESQSVGVGGQTPSRLNDLNPDEIESIEILKGPAASTLYGTAAANGVIQITTKRGRAGETAWNLWYELGSSEQFWDIPSNYGFLNAAGDTLLGELPAVAAGDETFGSVLSFNPLQQSGIFQTGQRQQIGTSVSGGTAAVRYFVSGELETDNGIVKASELDRVSLRANIEATPREDLELSIQTGYLTSELLQPQNDNNTSGILPQGLLGLPYRDENNGFYDFDPANTLAFRTVQDIQRFTSSGNATWRPLEWLSLIGTAGVDALSRDDQNLLPANVITSSTNNRIGFRTRNRFAVNNYTATATATANFQPLEWLATTSTVGTQFLRQDFTGANAFGRGILAGSGSLEGASEQYAVGETNQDERTIGFYGRQQFAFRDRLFLTASFRSDANSNFGDNVGFVTYPQVEGSWVVNEESFWPQSEYLSTLRVRAAWGQSGLPPGFRTANQFFTPQPVRVQGAEVPAFVIGGAGNVDLEPEVISETELGFDLGLFNSRVGLEFTYFSKLAEDAIVARPLAPSLGLTNTQLANIGELANWGTEWLLSAQIATRENFALDATVNFSTLRQNLNRLREGVAPIIFGLGGDSQRHQPGYPMGGYWGFTYTYDDANGDNLISDDEVQISEEQEYLGTFEPKQVLGVTLNATLFRNFRVSTLVDYRGGHRMFNSTEEFRCGFQTCRGLNDPTAPLWEQARAVAATDPSTPSIQGFVEDASLVRLREVSLSFNVPAEWAGALRAKGATISLAGRNLATWTDYTGSDPEINFAGQSNFTRAEFLSQPPVRSFSLRFNFNY